MLDNRRETRMIPFERNVDLSRLKNIRLLQYMNLQLMIGLAEAQDLVTNANSAKYFQIV